MSQGLESELMPRRYDATSWLISYYTRGSSLELQKSRGHRCIITIQKSGYHLESNSW